jgi:hypothetical protein
MSSYLYVSIEQGTRHLLDCPGSSMPSISSHQCTDTLQRTCPPPTLATCWEILIACFASLITSAYTLHHEKRVIAAVRTFVSEIGAAAMTDNLSRALVIRPLNPRFLHLTRAIFPSS